MDMHRKRLARDHPARKWLKSRLENMPTREEQLNGTGWEHFILSCPSSSAAVTGQSSQLQVSKSIFWDPATFFPTIDLQAAFKCIKCGGSCLRDGWSRFYEIPGQECTFYLVARKYRHKFCRSAMKVADGKFGATTFTAADPIVLQRLPDAVSSQLCVLLNPLGAVAQVAEARSDPKTSDSSGEDEPENDHTSQLCRSGRTGAEASETLPPLAFRGKSTGLSKRQAGQPAPPSSSATASEDESDEADEPVERSNPPTAAVNGRAWNKAATTPSDRQARQPAKRSWQEMQQSESVETTAERHLFHFLLSKWHCRNPDGTPNFERMAAAYSAEFVEQAASGDILAFDDQLRRKSPAVLEAYYETTIKRVKLGTAARLAKAQALEAVRNQQAQEPFLGSAERQWQQHARPCRLPLSEELQASAGFVIGKPGGGVQPPQRLSSNRASPIPPLEMPAALLISLIQRNPQSAAKKPGL